MNSAIVGILRALLTANTAEFESAMKRSADSAKVFSRDLKSVGQQATAIGSSLTKTVTLPIVAMGLTVAKLAGDFESSFAGVRKTVNATEAEFTQMAEGFRQLARTIPVNVNELNRLGEAAGALGIPKEEVVDFARVMALLGVTTNVTSDQAAESVAKIQNIFGAAGKDTERFASTLVALGNDGASTESQILEMAKRISGAGNAINMTQGEVLAFASALSSVGIEAEMGGSAISRVFMKIATAVSQGGDAISGFAKTADMTGAAFSKLFKDDAATAVNAFIEGLARTKKEGGDLIGTLTDLGFKEVRIRDTLLRAAGAGDLLTRALNLQKTAWEQNTAMTTEANKRFETTWSQMTLLWNRVKDVGITVGNALLPGIKSLVSMFDSLLPVIRTAGEMFAALPGPVQAVGIGMLAVIAAIGPALLVFGTVTTAVSNVSGAFAKNGIATRLLGTDYTALSGFVAKIPNVASLAEKAFASLTVAETGSSVALGTFAATIGPFIVAFAALTAAIGIGEQAWNLWRESRERAAAAARQGVVDQNTIAIAEKYYEMLQKAAGVEAKFQKHKFVDIEEATTFLRLNREKIAGLQQTETQTKKNTQATADDGESAKEAAKAYKEWFDAWADGLDDLAIDLPKVRGEVGKISTDMMRIMASDGPKTITDGLAGMGKAFNEHLPGVNEGLDGWIERMSALGIEIKFGQATVEKFGASFKAALTSLPQTVTAAFTGGGNPLKAIGSALGGALGTDVAGSLAKKIGEHFLYENSASELVTKGLGKFLGNAVTTFVPLIGSLLGPAISGLGKLFGNLFGNGEVKKVNDMRDAFITQAGGLGTLNEAAHKAGLTLDAMLKASTVTKYTAEVEKLKAAIDFQNSAVAELAAVEEEYHYSANTSVAELYRKYQILLGAQHDEADVLRRQKDGWQGIVAEALKFGTALPGQIRDVIQHLIDMGLLVDENDVKLTDISQLNFTDVGDSGYNAFDHMSEGIDKLVAAIRFSLGLALTEVERQLLGLPAIAQSVANQIPPNPFAGWHPPNVPGYESYAPPDEGGPGYGEGAPATAWTGGLVSSMGIQRFAGGGIARALSRMFRPVGSDRVPAMLGVGEMVLNDGQQSAVGTLVARGLQSGAGGGGVIHVHVNMDGREAAQAIVPFWPGALERAGVR